MWSCLSCWYSGFYQLRGRLQLYYIKRHRSLFDLDLLASPTSLSIPSSQRTFHPTSLWCFSIHDSQPPIVTFSALPYQHPASHRSCEAVTPFNWTNSIALQRVIRCHWSHSYYHGPIGGARRDQAHSSGEWWFSGRVSLGQWTFCRINLG